MTRLSRGTARTASVLAAVVAAALTLAGCASGTPAASPSPAAPSASATLSGDLTVFAAASLTKTFTQLGTAFQEANPGTKVTFSFAGSSDLVTQLTEGAPGDVFASADEANMQKLTAKQLIAGTPSDFATNTLEIAVPPGNPAKVSSLQSLAASGVKTVLCAPQVPCGAAAAKVEQAAGITIPAVSEESSVTDVLGKVTSGEADAGLVYVTDVRGAGSAVEGIAFPEAASAVNTYPIGVLQASSHAELARAFVAFVLGTEGQRVLRQAGFGAPGSGSSGTGSATPTPSATAG